MLMDIHESPPLLHFESLYWFCALAGSGIFLLQFLLNMVGLTSLDNSEAWDGHDEGAEGSQDSSHAKIFKWLSLKTITAFMIVFGWTAIACQTEFKLQALPTIGIATSIGLLAALVIRLVFGVAMKLISTGTIFNIEDAIGKEAYVYQSIPEGGIGRISISLHDITHEIDAVSLPPKELASFTQVKIIKKHDNNTVVVVSL